MMVEDPQMRVVIDRLPYYAQVKTYTLLSEWGKDLTRLESEGALFEEEVAAGGVLFTDEVSEYKHFKYRVHVAMVDTEHYGPILYGTSPLQSHRTPARVRFMGRPVGYDNDDVYRRLCGLTTSALISLREANVI
jgi:crotonobetainyl-CoA:carnitine CoA-transferase CaiB-like acyl-CoA transferase